MVAQRCPLQILDKEKKRQSIWVCLNVTWNESERKASVFADSACRETSILFGVFCLIKLKLSIVGALKEEEKNGKQTRMFVFPNLHLPA